MKLPAGYRPKSMITKLLLPCLAFCTLTLSHGKDWGPFLEQPPITIRFDHGWHFTNTSDETLYAIMIQADEIPRAKNPTWLKVPKVIIDSIAPGKTVTYRTPAPFGTIINITAKDYSKPLPVSEPE